MKTNRIIVQPYSALWEQSFRDIRAELQDALGKLALRIEHVGSTAVPGLSAKPIIDVDVVIRDYSVFEAVVSGLRAIGYTHEGDLGIAGREAFRYEGKEHLQKHHLYICPLDSAELERHIAFRDYLRSHPEAVQEYSRLKEEGARLYPNDVDQYIQHKSPFIEKIYREIGLDRSVKPQGKATVYYRDNELIIRTMEEADARIFTDEEIAQGWHTDISKYLARLQDQSAGKCVSLTAVYNGLPAGYVNVYFAGLGGAFSGKGYPEIVDFGVLEKYRRKGIGSKLMDAAEEIAGQYAGTVWLGVGLHSGYGSAQRMYVKRGYIPDGTGVWYRNKPCAQYETEIANDDDLVLFLSKRLEQQSDN